MFLSWFFSNFWLEVTYCRASCVKSANITAIPKYRWHYNSSDRFKWVAESENEILFLLNLRGLEWQTFWILNEMPWQRNTNVTITHSYYHILSILLTRLTKEFLMKLCPFNQFSELISDKNGCKKKGWVVSRGKIWHTFLCKFTSGQNNNFRSKCLQERSRKLRGMRGSWGFLKYSFLFCFCMF